MSEQVITAPLSRISVWCENLSAQALEPHFAQLQSVGIEPVTSERADKISNILLFFSEPTPELYARLKQLSQTRNGLARVLVIALNPVTGHSRLAWDLLQSGASDVMSWSSGSDESARAIAARLMRWHVIDELLSAPVIQNNLVGKSKAWSQVLRQVIEIARFTDASVLVTGESGTGKELIARLIHTLDERDEKRKLIVLDCTTIVPELSGSEFFGHERGAFTGAMNTRDGAFALADGGTLFLDEVGELPLTLQAELLRVVQERTYKRVGSNQWRETAFRLVCATNRDLLQEEAQGNFRRDFYYRIATWTCHLPPLRERVEDIVPLAQHFLAQLSPHGEAPELDEVVRDYLLQRAYPGNVRELRQLMTRIARRHVGPGPVTVGDIPEAERPRTDAAVASWYDNGFEQAIQRAVLQKVGLKEIGRLAEEKAEHFALAEADGNLQRAAQTLGITDRALQMRRAQRRQNGNG